MVRLLFTKGFVKDFECKMLNKEDGVRICLTSAKLYPEQGVIEGSIIDITARKKAEDALADSVAKYRALVENAEDAILLTDLSGKQIYRNPAYYRSLGFEENYPLDLSEFARVHPADVALLKEKLKKLPKTRRETWEYRIRHRDGSWRCRSAKSTVIYNINHQPYAILLIIRDITEHKKAEEKLRESEAQHKSLFSAMNEGFCYHELIFDKNDKPVDYKILDVNQAYELNTGLKREDVIGRKASEIYDVKEPPHLSIYAKVAKTQKPLSFETYFKPLSRYLKISVFSPEKNKFATVVSDITEIKKVHNALKESEANYRNLFNGMDESAWVIDFNANFIDVNDAAVKTLGYSKETLLSSGIKGIDNYLTPDQAKYHLDCLISGKNKVFETMHTTVDGRQIPVEISSSLITFQGKQAVLSIARNISERKKSEEELKQTLNQLSLVNEKLSVVGSLTRHDVKNKLLTVNSYAYLLKKKHKDLSDTVEMLSKIERAVADSEEIFEFSKMYEQLGVEKLTCIDVGAAVDEATALFSDFKLKISNKCHGKRVVADSFLRQMFYNFFENTKKYGKKASTIKVYCEQEKSGELRLICEDDGVGISAENKKKLFCEGFSTGGSTGLGLFFIKKMMDVYGWTIIEEGEPGKGAKFIVIIPQNSR